MQEPNILELALKAQTVSNNTENAYLSSDSGNDKNSYIDMTEKEIGLFIKQERGKRSLSESELAEKTNTSLEKIQAIEAGISVDRQYVNNVLELFGFRMTIGVAPIVSVQISKKEEISIESMDNESIGKLVKSHRNSRGITQSELANASNVSLRTIQRLEKGGGVYIETLQSILAVFDIGLALKK